MHRGMRNAYKLVVRKPVESLRITRVGGKG